MKRTPMPPRHTRAKRKVPARSAKHWQDIRIIVYARANCVCDLCGTGLRFREMDAHHRLLRKQGGKDEVAHLVALHRHCHEWVHRNPDEAKAIGFICPFWREPEHWPLLLHKDAWVVPVEDRWQPSSPHPDQIGAPT